MRFLVAVLGLVLMPATVFAQSQPSAKEAVQVSANALIPATRDSNGWVPILSASLKMPEQKDLFVGVSLETGLMTDTLVRSKGGTSDTSWAEANLQVRVLIDGIAAEPGVVTFDKRRQTLMATFNGICTDTNGDNIVNFDECQTPEELQLILDTLEAHHFNFAVDDLGSGIHTIVVEARVTTSANWQLGSASATGAVGKGTVTVEEVRLVKGTDITK